jgi:phage tail-like protein
MKQPVTQAANPPTKQMLDYLPAIYREGDDRSRTAFLALYLRAFERILFGGTELRSEDSAQDSSDSIEPGLEEEVAAIPSLFDPWQTPEEFLPWLANWAALSFHPELSAERRRRLLAHMIPLYRIRGTRKYIEDLLGLCLDTFVLVTDAQSSGLQVGRHATIGVDTYLDGAPPYFFIVQLIAPGLTDSQKETQLAVAHAILSQAKPAHTSYELALASPRMQIGVHSAVGVDTVLSPSL